MIFATLLVYANFFRLVTYIIKKLGKGSGTTLPGLFLEKYYPACVSILGKDFEQIMMISGTNGKTTTRSLLVKSYKDQGITVCTNLGGANIYRGIITTLLFNLSWNGKAKSKIAILEVEEASLPKLTKHLKPTEIILTNLFRDQLDAYGEIDTTLAYFVTSLNNSPNAKIVINGDDQKLLSVLKGGTLPQITTFSLLSENKPSFEHTLDQVDISKFPRVIASQIQSKNLVTKGVLELEGQKTSFETNLIGDYNLYNMLAVSCHTIPKFGLQNALDSMTATVPVFGRGEKIIIDNQIIYLFLVKNPTGMNQVFNLIKEQFQQKDLKISLLLNDNIADGRDVSWLWDCDFEGLVAHSKYNFKTAGTRGLDMLLRLEIAGAYIAISDDYRDTTDFVKSETTGNNTHLILATYTAMRQVRAILGTMTKLSDIGDEGN